MKNCRVHRYRRRSRLSAPASAQFAKAEDAIKYRQSAFFVMGQHFSRIGAMANGRRRSDARLRRKAPTSWR